MLTLPPPGPPPPVGPPGAPPAPPGPPGPPGVVEGEGATLDEGLVVGVVLLLGPLSPWPPQPTANTSMAVPPITATAVLAAYLIRTPLSVTADNFCTPPAAHANDIVCGILRRRCGRAQGLSSPDRKCNR